MRDGSGTEISALRVWKKRLLPLCLRTLLCALLRVPPLCCVFLALSGNDAALLPGWAWAAAGVLLHVLTVIPARAYYRRALARELSYQDGDAGYGCLLKTGLMRYARGLLWGLPFLAGAGYFWYSMEVLPYNEQGLLFEAIARFFGFPQGSGLVAKGAWLYGAMLLLLLLLFIFGWRRDIPADDLPVRAGKETEVFSLSRRVRRAGRVSLRKNTLGNFLLSLPGLAASALALTPYVLENVRVSGNISVLWRSVKRMLTQWPPVRTLLPLALALLLIALPLCALRRLRTVSLVRELALRETGGENAAR